MSAMMTDTTAITVHPLALVNLSDHTTRRSESAIGLLLGSEGTIVDALDAPLDDAKAVELHQAVFPHHRVVGWYRSGAPEPTLEDLQHTQKLQSLYPDATLFATFPVLELFCLHESALLSREYRVHSTLPEQIGIESLVPHNPQARALDSLEQLQKRVTILIQYLETQPKDSKLYRHIQALVLQLGALAPEPQESLLPALAALAQTARIVEQYIEAANVVRKRPGGRGPHAARAVRG